MKNNKIKTKTNLFTCHECGLKYSDTEWRDKCEKWCKDNKSCNLNIIKHSIKK